MLIMDQYAYIRTAHRVYGKSIREIARETGHDRKTVRKVLNGKFPNYSKRKEQPYPALGPYLATIDAWLETDKEVHKKQRHTATRIYHRLVSEQAYPGSETSVRRYVRDAKLRLGLSLSKAFIPCQADIAAGAEIDWGVADIYLRGEPARIRVFCMRSKYSGRVFVRAYPCERQQAFFDAHMHAFAFFGGVFKTLIYDNLTTAVEKILKGKDRREQREFSKFHAHFCFSPRFCNPNSGHEKGGVEGTVGFSRRNFLVPVPRVDSLEALNEQLLRDCLAYGSRCLHGQERTVEELFEEECGSLLATPTTEFSNLQTVDAKVSAYSTVRVDSNRYSVPTRHAGTKVQVLLRVDQIEIFHSGKRIAVHERLFGKGKWQIDPDHYLELLRQRPGAFDAARPIREWRKSWPEVFEMFLARLRQAKGESAAIKEFVAVLMLVKEHGQGEVADVVTSALKAGGLSADSIRQMLLLRRQGPVAEPLVNWPVTEPADVSVYAQLGEAI
jgi:transposase